MRTVLSRIWQAAALVALAVAAYGQALRSGFIWDDDTVLFGNPLVRAADGLRRIWFTTQSADYWPVTQSSFWIEWRLWGMHAAGYHATNLALHALTVLLFWTLLRRLAVPGAWLAAALFAVHPVNAETVAWIAERKNLLAMAFFLGSILCYLPAEEPGGRRAWLWYGSSLAFFALAMLSKGSAAPLPVVLLGLTWARRRPAGRDFARLAPFFAISAGLVLVNVWFQRHGPPGFLRPESWPERVLGAGAAVSFYLRKAFIPVHLAFFYPQWRIRIGELHWWLPSAEIVLITGILWWGRARGAAPALWAWLYFLAMLVPVLGLVDVTYMRFSLVANHYEHLPLLGLAALAGFGWARWRDAAARGSPLPVAVAAGAIAVLGLLTWNQTGIYRDLPTLYVATLRENPDSCLARNNLAVLLLDQGRSADAEAQLEEAVRLNPDYADARYNLAGILSRTGRLSEAIDEYRAALRLKPNYPGAWNNLGNALDAAGRLPEAAEAYRAALRLEPDNAGMHRNLASVLARLGDVDGAAAEYRAAERSVTGPQP